MAEIAAEIVRPVIEDAVKWVGATIKRQFNYFCCFTSNIATLKYEAQNLDDAAAGLLGRVDREIDNVLVIVPEVETWIKRSNDIKDEMNGILNEATNVGSGCLKLGARFSLSKRANRTTDRMIELRGQCKFDAISQPGPPPATKPVPLGKTHDFESRRKIEEDIMTSLRGSGDVNMIGICGMGGLGKTTMAKRLMNKALEQHLFEEVAMTVVSKQVDKLKIQEDIGVSLGLKLEGETFQVRVQKLHARLSGTKRILLVLDDVWEALVLEDLGIPLGCKILLTSRNSDTLSEMNVEMVFGMKMLSKEEAWLLFRGTTGTCVDDTGLHSIAKEVVKECRGLPIALTIVGATLKDVKNVRIWNDALRQLTHCDPDIPQLIEKVYNPLKLSYDALGSKHAKSVFLLCCLFGEDANIPVEKLTYFCLGLGIFGGISNLEEARNRMSALIYKKLETISFVRGLVHLEILSCRDCHSIKELPPEMKELNILKLLDLTECGNLERIGRGIISSLVGLEELKMLGSFKKWEAARDSNARENGNAMVRELKALTNLRCLEIEIDDPTLAAENMRLSSKLERFQIRITYDYVYRQLELLPYSFNKTMILKWEGETCAGEWIEKQLIRDAECLHLTENGANNVDYMAKSENIRRLDLHSCETMKNIGRTSLVDAIVFPHMEYLRLSFLPQLEEILDGPISSNSFHNLKELKLECMPALKLLWKSSNSPVLHNLSYIFIYNCPKLEEILYGPISSGSFQNLKIISLRELPALKQLWKSSGSPVFHNLSSISIVNCPKLEEILDGPISSSSFHNLKELHLRHLPALKQLWKSSTSPVFHNLSSMRIVNCPKLEEILDGPISSDSFLNLKELEVQDLPALKQLWKSSSSPVLHNLSSIRIINCRCLRNLGQLSSIEENNCLSQLQTLTIAHCEVMEQVFLWNEEDERRITKSMFPKLMVVELVNLPNLVTLCQRIGSIEFPLPTIMSNDECPKMKSMVSSEENNYGGSRNADIDDYHSPHLFCQPQNVSFSFHGSEDLTISNYEGRMSLFSSSIAQNLVNLMNLEIIFCRKIVKVIEDEKEEENVVRSGGAQTTTTILFPKLQTLKFNCLEKLENFCEWKCEVELPSLWRVEITGCDDMKIFNLGPLFTPNLEVVQINNEYVRGEKRLNGVLKQQYLETQKEKAAYWEKQKKTTEEEEEEEEEEGTNGEIEEEQNW